MTPASKNYEFLTGPTEFLSGSAKGRILNLQWPDKIEVIQV